MDSRPCSKREQICPELQKMLRTIREFGNYISRNQAYVPIMATAIVKANESTSFLLSRP
jgi:hypothetical protein